MIPKTARKYLSVTSNDLVNHCFNIFSWIPLKMVKSLLFISACAFASSVKKQFSLQIPLQFADSAYKFCRFHLHLRIPLAFCGIPLQLRNPEQLAKFACCGIHNKLNTPTKFMLQEYVREIHVNLVSAIH